MYLQEEGGDGQCTMVHVSEISSRKVRLIHRKLSGEREGGGRSAPFIYTILTIHTYAYTC